MRNRRKALENKTTKTKVGLRSYRVSVIYSRTRCIYFLAVYYKYGYYPWHKSPLVITNSFQNLFNRYVLVSQTCIRNSNKCVRNGEHLTASLDGALVVSCTVTVIIFLAISSLYYLVLSLGSCPQLSNKDRGNSQLSVNVKPLASEFSSTSYCPIPTISARLIEAGTRL